MSRAFVKEDADGGEVLVAQRAPLPPGVPNLVTRAGHAALERERAERLAELEALEAAESTQESRRLLATRREEYELLLGRIATARVVEPPAERDVADVGATVRVRYGSGAQAGRTAELTIVGVDEADPLEGLVAFTAPLARALIGKRPGMEASFDVGEETLRVTLEEVSYP